MSDAPALQPGDLVERYRVEALLGEGATARVYRVRHELLGTRHALKVLLVEGRSLVDRMLQEARVQARLRHPHVVAVSDVLTWEGRPCLVMELVDGPSLEHRLIEGGPLPWPEAVALVRPLVDAMARAHAEGVLHRDIKPANVLLAPGPPPDQHPQPKLTDFGLARIFAAGEALEGGARAGRTQRRVTMGTPGYMAPEQWADAATADERADVFGLAAVLYAAVAGRAPFPTEGVEALEATVRGDCPALDRVTTCPPALAAVVARGLAPAPEERWPSASALGLALDQLAAGEAPPAPAPGATLLPEAEAPPARRAPPAALLGLPLAFLGAALAVVGLATGLVVYTALRPEEAARRAPAIVELPATTFWRGDTLGEGQADERPVEEVAVAAFALDRTEVRTDAFLACVAAGACTAPAWQTGAEGYGGLTGEAQPIVGVTWSQAGAYCAWRGGRLPTEVEWERAATWSAEARVAADKRRWPWGEAEPTCALAHHAACSPQGTVAVDALPDGATADGLLGMAGNAWEWTASTYPLRKRIFQRQETHYVLRGGAWDSQPSFLRPTFRRHSRGADARPNTSFRCAYDRT